MFETHGICFFTFTGKERQVRSSTFLLTENGDDVQAAEPFHKNVNVCMSQKIIAEVCKKLISKARISNISSRIEIEIGTHFLAEC